MSKLILDYNLNSFKVLKLSNCKVVLVTKTSPSFTGLEPDIERVKGI
jgi:hypothetical protein